MKRTVLSTAQASKATQMHGYLQTQSGGKKRFGEREKKKKLAFPLASTSLILNQKNVYVIPPKPENLNGRFLQIQQM